MRRNKILSSLHLYIFCLVLAALQPLTVFAEEPAAATTPPTPAEQTQTPPPATTAAPSTTATAPTSASPPATQQTAPAAPPKTYNYDTASGRWNSNEWTYDPSSNSYVPTPKPAPAQQPQVTPTIVEPAPAQSSSTVSSTTTNEIANALDSLALTGSSSVGRNTTGGSATSGNAAATATIVNNINSSMTNANNTEAATFVSDVMGDVNGDIMLQPMLLKAMLEANAVQQNNLNSTTSNSVTNDISLTAKSGDADVTGNTKAGNATSGSANTVVDVVNLVNSMVAANQSFVGTVNIYGNLNGDILIAPDFIPQLLASNNDSLAPSISTVNASDTQQIVNNVSLAAESGAALVSENTKAGDATTGEADTNLVIFNLSGHDIVASNSLLVFVNVLGKWVGVIVDAPVGATAAAVGNEVSSHTKQTPSLAVTSVNDTSLVNNISLSSQSGDASVVGNTNAGGAQSGDATASANIANISNSQLGLSGWFGILFINVYGNWIGSFGVDTSAGDPLKRTAPGKTTLRSSGSDDTKRVIQFRPNAEVQAPANLRVVDPKTPPPPATAVLAQSTTSPGSKTEPVSSDMMSPSATRLPAESRQVQLPLLIGSLLLVGGSLYILRRYLF